MLLHVDNYQPPLHANIKSGFITGQRLSFIHHFLSVFKTNIKHKHKTQKCLHSFPIMPSRVKCVPNLCLNIFSSRLFLSFLLFHESKAVLFRGNLDLWPTRLHRLSQELFVQCFHFHTINHCLRGLSASGSRSLVFCAGDPSAFKEPICKTQTASKRSIQAHRWQHKPCRDVA